MTEIELNPDLQKLAVDNFYDYMRYKAINFLEIGYKDYRKQDAFGMPDFKMSKKKLKIIESACKQIEEYKGMTKETAFENIDIDGFYTIMNLFHYELCKQSIAERGEDYFIDKMYIKHIVTGNEMILYNKVKK